MRRPLIALLTGALALALAGGCKKTSGACDVAALQAAVDRAQSERAEHPAWFGDLTPNRRLGPALVRRTLTEGCRLPSELQRQLDVLVEISSDQRATALKEGPQRCTA